MSQFRDLVDELKAKVRSKWPPYNSWHEAHSVLREEFEEFWDEVKRKEGERDPQKLLSELVDIVQVAERAAEDFKLVSVEPTTHEDRESYYAEKYLTLAHAVISFLTIAVPVKLNKNLQLPKDDNRKHQVDIREGSDKILSLLVPREYYETLESLVEDDRVLPAQSA